MSKTHDVEQEGGRARRGAPDPSIRAYYDGYWESEGWDCRPPARLVELLGRYVSPEQRCIDVGCGDGGTSGVWLAEHATEYVGVDVSESAVQMARKRGLDARVIGDGAALPFPDGSFDAAVCTEVLEHLFEPQRVVAEIERVLRPGGVVIISVPNAAHWRNRLDLAILGRWNPRGDQLSAQQPWRDPHVRFFTLGSLARLIALSGFDVLERGGDAQSGLLQQLPGLRGLTRTRRARWWTRFLTRRFPRLLAETLYVVGEADPKRG